MRTFGNPAMLSDPFTPSPLRFPPLDLSDDDEPIIEGIEEEFAVTSPIYAAPLNSRSIKYRDESNDITYDFEWNFKTYKEMHVAKRTEEGNQSEMEASFDLDWNQKTLFTKRLPRWEITMIREGGALMVNGFLDGKRVDKVLKFPNKPYPWIQQPQIGFRHFILSKQNKTHFYGVHPESIEITECLAIKEQVHLAPYGTVIKVEFYLNEGMLTLFGPLHVSTCWFNPKNCDLLKCEYRLGLFAWGKSNIIQD
jgi:hypothetical protein